MKQIVESTLSMGVRIPNDFFVTKGKGESDVDIHTGSYHLALQNAGIEKYNIMTYSSVLPPTATKVPHTQLPYGAVMETISAVATATTDEQATAGIVYGWLYDKATGEKFGGLVCERNGAYSDEEIKEELTKSIRELYTNGFEDTHVLSDVTFVTESITAKKKFGTAIVAICFVNYRVAEA